MLYGVMSVGVSVWPIGQCSLACNLVMTCVFKLVQLLDFCISVREQIPGLRAASLSKCINTLTSYLPNLATYCTIILVYCLA